MSAKWVPSNCTNILASKSIRRDPHQRLLAIMKEDFLPIKKRTMLWLITFPACFPKKIHMKTSSSWTVLVGLDTYLTKDFWLPTLWRRSSDARRSENAIPCYRYLLRMCLTSRWCSERGEAISSAIPKVFGNNSSNSDCEFRLISLAAIPAKVVEKIIHKKLLSCLSRFHAITPKLHGFLSGASICTNIGDRLFDFTQILNAAVDVIYVDLSNVFDKLCHWNC